MKAILLASCLVAAISATAHDHDSWVAYRNKEQGFRASFPAHPDTAGHMFEMKGYQIPVKLYGWHQHDAMMAVGTVTYPPELPVKGREEFCLDNGIRALVNKDDAQISQSESLKVAGFPGRHILYTDKWQHSVELFIVLRGQRMYMVMGAARGEGDLQNPMYAKFYASFDFVGK